MIDDVVTPPKPTVEGAPMPPALEIRRVRATVLEGLLRDPEAFLPEAFGDSAPLLDLYKDWRELCIGLAGTDEEDGSLPSRAIYGHRSMDAGGGAAIPFLDPSDVVDVAAAIAQVAEDVFLGRIMDEIGGPQAADNASLEEHFRTLRLDLLAFYEAAAAQGEAVLMWWS